MSKIGQSSIATTDRLATLYRILLYNSNIQINFKMLPTSDVKIKVSVFVYAFSFKLESKVTVQTTMWL